ncbi:MAG: sulfurtransferase TusA family protein [Deltaproteobacteria bacterium]|nr:sulfurtransferase TusA family protein [Deltaproteobacteria bacterium]
MSSEEPGDVSAATIDVRGLDVPRALIATRDAYRRLAAGESLGIVADPGPEVDQAIASYFEKRRHFYELTRPGAGQVRIRVTRPN